MAKARVGRPLSDDPLTVRKLIRMTPEDEMEFLDECKRLEHQSGVKWTISAYGRVAMRLMKGKHLP